MTLKLKYVTLTLVGLSTLPLLWLSWQYFESHPSTDNAYVNSRQVHISTQVGGTVDKIFIENNQLVNKGQALFRLDRRPFLIEVEKAKAQLALAQQSANAAEDATHAAKAQLAVAQAEFAYDKKNYDRIKQLVNQGKISLSEGDKAQAKLSISAAHVEKSHSLLTQAQNNQGQHGSANASIRQAKAALAQAKLNLSYTVIKAPTSGKISNVSLVAGDIIHSGQILGELVDQQDWWIDANFKETQLSGIKPHQQVTIHLDMFPGTVLSGTVESVSAATGANFSILPPENALGNWVKITQRIPIKIHILKTDLPLVVGSSAQVTIDTNSK